MAQAADRALDRARRVQRGMLPRVPRLAGLEIHTHYAPCEAVGGDFYDLIRVDDAHWAFVVGDVAGHGLHAALVMAAAKKSIQVHSQGRRSPAEVLRVVAADLAPELPPGVFLTVLHAVLHLPSGQLRVARAGHPPLVRRAADGTVARLGSAGLPVGAAAPDRFAEALQETLVTLAPGDTLVAFTDGLTETMDGARVQYGEGRLDRFLATASGTPDALAAAVLADVAGHRADATPADDCTLLVWRWTGAAGAGAGEGEQLGNIPAAGDAFVGRAAERQRLDTWLGRPGALVACHGLAGIGTSRLAAEAARAQQALLPGGAWWAECRAVTTPAGLAHAVARAFGLPLEGGSPVQEVANLLRDRPPLCVVLDGVDGVRTHLAGTLGAWRSAAPEHRWITTGRVAPGLPGEQPLALTPLGVEDEAVALLTARVEAARPDRPLADADRAALGEIAAALDGLPLALELAAARCAALAPAELARQLDAKMDWDTGGPGSRSLEQALALSTAALDPAARTTFEQLSVFCGGCTFEAAAAVVDLSGVPNAPPLIDALQALRGQGLLRTVHAGRTTRFVLLGTLRDHAARRWERTAPPSARQALRRRFIDHCVHYTDTWAGRVRGPAALDALDRLADELDNGFAAFDAALAAGQAAAAARIILALVQVMLVRGPGDQRVPRLEAALAAVAAQPSTREGPLLRARLHHALSFSRHLDGDWDGAVAEADAAVALSAEVPDQETRARHRYQRAALHIYRGEFAEGLAALDRVAAEVDLDALPIMAADLAMLRAAVPLMQGHTDVGTTLIDRAEAAVRRSGCPTTIARWAEHRANAHGMAGEWEAGLRRYAEAEAIFTEARDPVSMARLLGNRAQLLRMRGDFAGAMAAAGDAEALARALGHRHQLAAHLHVQAVIATHQGDPAGALARFNEALSAYEDAGDPRNAAGLLRDRAAALIALDRPLEARADLERALAAWDGVEGVAPVPRFGILGLLAQAEHRAGRANEARRRAAEALDLAEREDIPRAHPDPDVREVWRVLDGLLGG